MTTEELNEMYDYLVNVVGVSEETVQVVTAINGFSKESMEDILFVTAGYTDFEQCKNEYEN